MTVKELCNSFMSRYARDRLRPTTIRGYQTNIDLHVLPILGDLEIGALTPIRFHDLRHSYATLMLRQGVNPKIVSTVLGHSCIAITLNIYSHPDIRMQAVCLEALDEE